MYDTFNGFRFGILTKCFGIDVKREYQKDIKAVVAYYKRDGFLRDILNTRGQAWTTFHYPKQILLVDTDFRPLFLHKDDTTNNFMSYLVINMEILKRRQKGRDHCTTDWRALDDLAVNQHIENKKCRAPYHAPYSNVPICSTQNEISLSRYEWVAVRNKTLKPCQAMSKIDIIKLNIPPTAFKPKKTQFAIGIVYPMEFKFIIQSQAVDTHALIGNIGGYIGLFLGMVIQ